LEHGEALIRPTHFERALQVCHASSLRGAMQPQRSTVTWDSIGGLEDVKRTLRLVPTPSLSASAHFCSSSPPSPHRQLRVRGSIRRHIRHSDWLRPVASCCTGRQAALRPAWFGRWYVALSSRRVSKKRILIL
jgi:hypothetical protein